jgi:hypothetical protein
MPGPSSSDHHSGSDGPPVHDSPPGQPTPASTMQPLTPYPGPLPPPQPYPKPRRRRLFLGGLAALLVAAAVAAAILHATHRASAPGAGTFSDATASAAIQRYLDALAHRDADVIARNALCGIYDGVRDRRSDQALAKLSSDAFRRQFSEAQVTSIDKIVYWSDYQAQVLFTMRVQVVGGGGERSQMQGVAQLLSQRNQVLVCSYVLHGAGLY